MVILIMVILLATFRLLTASSSVKPLPFVDPETPSSQRFTTSLSSPSSPSYTLVMSDEFNTPGRSFGDGQDDLWTAPTKPDDDMSAIPGAGSLHFYNDSMVRTNEDGFLEIRTVGETTRYTAQMLTYDEKGNKVVGVNKVEKYFKSGMVQGWNKFCFTGGIVEVDVVLPGSATIGGLWPAIWLLGNLGRNTYEQSTNKIWPWSFDKCDFEKQAAQEISACDKTSHFGMAAGKGRGATEIDILETMQGDPKETLTATYPTVNRPYGANTLQIAPGIPAPYRPYSGSLPPQYRATTPSSTKLESLRGNVWYSGLDVITTQNTNTSLNPFFYGTSLSKTKPEEPVYRSANEAYQADAIGAIHSMNSEWFQVGFDDTCEEAGKHRGKKHKPPSERCENQKDVPVRLRMEWQPGKNGSISWFHKLRPTDPSSEWIPTFEIKDESLTQMGSQIPTEPSYLIFNVAVSTTWGFPFSADKGCTRCFDCDDPACGCNFSPGFCNMLKNGDVAMLIDSVRLYQLTDSASSAYPANPHTIGCDPVDYPTADFIKGNEIRYTRPMPFDDKRSLKKIVKGGGECGSEIKNQTELCGSNGGGTCVSSSSYSIFSPPSVSGKRCKCSPNYSGSHCLTRLHKFGSVKSASKIQNSGSVFDAICLPWLPVVLVLFLSVSGVWLASRVAKIVQLRREERVRDWRDEGGGEMLKLRREDKILR